MFYQCYYTNDLGERCNKRQQDMWCSEEHKSAWQENNYVDKRPRGEHKLSVEDMQQRLKQMKPRA